MTICASCGVEFSDPKHKERKFCSRACSGKAYSARYAVVPPHPCLVCGTLVSGKHKYCSTVCSRTRWERATIKCEFCHREVDVSAAELRRVDRQAARFCSRSCAGRARAAAIVPKEIDPLFGSWLAGLADGEGCFELCVSKAGRVATRFSIGLRIDDRPVLNLIREQLGFGRIYTPNRHTLAKDGTPQHPVALFMCINVRECAVLAEVFRRYPLRTKKANDFAVWTEAIDAMLGGEGGRTTLMEMAARLRAVRAYPVPL